MTIRSPRLAARIAQRGVSLVFSLITLVALSLAAVALIRSVDTGATILGNLSFKQDTLLAADEATRQAIAWLDNNKTGTVLHASIQAQGYSAQSVARLDATGTRTSDNTRALIDWDMNNCAGQTAASCVKPLATALSVGNGAVQARWFIMRVCSAAGDPTLNTVACSRPITATTAPTAEKGEMNYTDPKLQQIVLSQYFRVIVRARGGRNTTSVTETLVHF
ncbi:pilus assembly PilX family protein [Leptothrix discophora]|uniref:Pilus assembly protein PilX n=1 Tax=Leptothrix discophora TaxID=89 RepID=A0ABT9G0S5_LEPDI|nr:pilus assembly protein PilX [Leptothrix discophora]MDP4300095.1 pilus assembly protein PilX [Leptothrix discophora]